MATYEGKEAAGLSAMGAAVYGAISDIASMIDEPVSIRPLDLDGYRRARFDELVAMPKDDLHDVAEEAVVDLGINTPTLREAVDGIASNVVDKPRDRRLVLVGSALMRRYHLVYLADKQESTDQASILDI